ncbi:hypothetical protein [Streptomyces sp. 2P-4]|uniref:hypothetical protein n=1 Tax=Streptomyces sp. 2P-4 TaxID=2931974 RepID=UPI002540AD36|nr:hypothetical protein [Streptomyces sp. 2P-4]
MTAHPAELDAEARTAAVVRLFAEVVTAHERNALTRLALRAGLMWRCHRCRADYYPTTAACTCGAPRPDGLA